MSAPWEGERIDPRLVGIGLTAAESALIECQFVALHKATYAKLFGLGIYGRALTGRDAFDALHVESVCFLAGRRFEFGRNLRNATGAVRAVIIPARDEDDDTRDLAAWSLDDGRVATWCGAVSMLGEDQLSAPRRRAGLHVHRNVVEWLRADRNGVVILDAKRARWKLAEEILAVDDPAFGLRLRAAMRLPEPGIVVRKAA